MSTTMKVEIIGDNIRLERDQWKGNVAYISNYPGLLDEVKKYTWTYSNGKHTYLNCSKLNVSLHRFVLQFLYGKEKLDEMLGKSNIIEHLDNNGLNCTYENLHILSDDLNKAKAFSIDKYNAELEAGTMAGVPALITDVYYSHKNKFFQLQVFFNKNIVFNKTIGEFVEEFVLRYNDFNNLFIDWLYCFESIKTEKFNIHKHHANKVYEKHIITFELREDEKNASLINRNGEWYLLARTDPENGSIAFVTHTPFEKIEDYKE